MAKKKREDLLTVGQSERAAYIKGARPTALALAGIAVSKDDPVGLRDALNALFGEEIDLCKSVYREVVGNL